MLQVRPLPLLLAALLSLAAAAAETPLTLPVQGPAVGSQYAPVVASDGDGYLVVWNDSRGHARATRVSPAGQALDGTGIVLFPNPDGRILVVWTGTSYLVVWGNLYAEDIGVQAVRLDRDGKIIDGPRALTASGTPVSITSNGSQVAVLYRTAASDLRALVVTPDAVPVNDVFLASAGQSSGPGHLAAAGSQFLVVWMHVEGNEIDPPIRLYGRRFTGGGAIDAEPRLLVDDRNLRNPTIASNGSSYLLLTGDAPTERTKVRRISADLSTIGEPVLLEDRFGNSIVGHPSVVWTGTSYAVLTHYGGTVVAAMLDAEGRPGTAQIVDYVPYSGMVSSPVAGTNGRDLFIAWMGSRHTDVITAIDVFGTVVGLPSLERLGGALLTRSAPQQILPRIASSGTNLLAVWLEQSSLMARRLRPDGSWLDAEPIHLAESVFEPVVLFNGIDYVVAWRTYDPFSIAVRRVPRDAALRLESGVDLPVRYAMEIAAASAGDVTLLAWNDGLAVRAVRLDQQAMPLDLQPLVVTEESANDLTISSDGSGRFLLVWTVLGPWTEHGGALPVAIRATRVDQDLTRLDAGFLVADGPRLEDDPAVTWNGSEWLVLWTRDRKEIRGRRVAANGTLADGVATDEGVLVATGAQAAQVTWDGSRYLLAWLSSADRLTTAWLTQFGSTPVFARDLGERTAGALTDVSFAPLRPGAVTTVYARIAREPQYGAVGRAFSTVIELQAGSRRRAVR